MSGQKACQKASKKKKKASSVAIPGTAAREHPNRFWAHFRWIFPQPTNSSTSHEQLGAQFGSASPWEHGTRRGRTPRRMLLTLPEPAGLGTEGANFSF